MDKVRYLLIQFGLPKTFWAEAICTAAYLINRSSSTTIEKKTPMDMWLGHPSNYGMLRIFGYVAYPHDKQVTSRNVVFNESVTYKDTLKDSGVGPDKSVEELQVEWNYREEEDTHEPLTYQEAVSCEDSSKWKAAMKEEMDSLMKNKTWELVDQPAGQNLVSCKWMFKIKEEIKGVQNPRNKAMLVARRFTQRACIDYNKVFSTVVRHTSIWVVLALTACKEYELEQLDVKTAFLHGNLEEVIYMRQPSRYEQGNKVCLLKKSLYGLKQSPRQWYRRFDEYMLSNRFKRSNYDSCIYYSSYVLGEYIYLFLYVDDMLIACKSKVEIGSTKSLLKKEFDMKELGEAKKTLGMEIVRDRSHKILRVSQSGYVFKNLNNFRIDNRKSVKIPLGGHFKLSLNDCTVKDCDVERMSKVSYANVVGSLMYLIVCMRPDIAYVDDNRGNHVDVTGFVNSDYTKDQDKGRSIIGYTFLVHGCVVSWKAMVQHMVAVSTTEAKYIALTEAVNEAIWLRGLLENLGVELNTVAINCDNEGAIHLSRNHVFHERTKHINVHYHFIREVLKVKTVKVLKVGTEHNVVDALTNMVPGLKLQHCLKLLNVGSCVLTRSNSASFETRLRFVSRRYCVLPKKTSCVLLKDSEDLQCAGFDHDHYQEAACAYHEEHMMHDCVQLDHVVDSHDEYTNDSNIIMCDQYVKDNEVPVVHSGVSSVPTDAFMMIYDDMCEPHDQSVSYPSRNTVVKNSITAELAIYKEHVELYEQRAKFELTEREQKINEQLRIVIFDRNFKEETNNLIISITR
nr:retrovirus-related Pol polyprotein from transposon TNT 1-94 [Tanacetum cinerariifolium]